MLPQLKARWNQGGRPYYQLLDKQTSLIFDCTWGKEKHRGHAEIRTDLHFGCTSLDIEGVLQQQKDPIELNSRLFCSSLWKLFSWCWLLQLCKKSIKQQTHHCKKVTSKHESKLVLQNLKIPKVLCSQSDTFPPLSPTASADASLLSVSFWRFWQTSKHVNKDKTVVTVRISIQHITLLRRYKFVLSWLHIQLHYLQVHSYERQTAYRAIPEHEWPTLFENLKGKHVIQYVALPMNPLQSSSIFHISLLITFFLFTCSQSTHRPRFVCDAMKITLCTCTYATVPNTMKVSLVITRSTQAGCDEYCISA